MKRLKRSEKDRIIAGVCGGLAEYFDIDPVLVRGLWVIALFFLGTGFLAYIIAWILIPEQNKINEGNTEESDVYEAEIVEDNHHKKKTEPAIFLGFVLIAIGSWFLMKRIPVLSDFYWWIKENLSNYFWPGILILSGFFLIITKNRKKN